MKEKLYTLLFFLLVTISGKAQDFNPGPEVQNLTERKNVTVDYATGLFHYTVPLYQLKSGDYELPISLDYIAKGVKVSDPEGLIGKIGHLTLGALLLEQCVVDLLTRHLDLVIYGQKMLLLHWSGMRGV